MEVTIVSTPEELAEVRGVVDAYAEYIYGHITKEDFSKKPRKVWVFMDKDTNREKFGVCDNRDSECFVEYFETLDGAVLYATDVHYDTRHSDEWDYMGAVADLSLIHI